MSGSKFSTASANEVRKVARSEVTQLPWGEWLQPMAFRKNVRGVLHFWRLAFSGTCI